MSWHARETTPEQGAVFAHLRGIRLIDNVRVWVDRFILSPGETTGSHAHPCHQLHIFTRGGTLSDTSGRVTRWSDGRVRWFTASEIVEAGAANCGRSDIEIVCVTLKPVPARSRRPEDMAQPLNYPNIPGEDLLLNDFVIVQRFVVAPGQWEGVHGHQSDTLYVHIRGGEWAVRSYNETAHVYLEPSPDGAVGWMDAVDPGEGHESGNVGPRPIDLIWVTLRT